MPFKPPTNVWTKHFCDDVNNVIKLQWSEKNLPPPVSFYHYSRWIIWWSHSNKKKMQCIAVYFNEVIVAYNTVRDLYYKTLCVTISSHQFWILKTKRLNAFLFSPLINFFCFDSWVAAKRECHCVHRYLVYVRNDKTRLDKHLMFNFSWVHWEWLVYIFGGK